MAPKPKSDTPPTGVPGAYPQTPPPTVGPDISTWVLNAVTRLDGATGKVDARLDGIEKQLEKLDSTLDRIEGEVRGHGKWLHTLQVTGGMLFVLIGWIVANAVWPWLKAKIGAP
jgi:hypothetical protein